MGIKKNIQFWNNRKVLVTGATGLVGSWLTSSLISKGAIVVVLVRDQDPQSMLISSGTITRTTVVNGTLENFGDCHRAITDHDIEIVFHLGAQTIVGSALKNPYSTFESNIRGTYNLLEACRLNKKQIQGVVIASSDKAYGTNPKLPYIEEMPLNGQHPYDVSKSCTDLIAKSYFNTYHIPIAIVRCGNIYGGGDLNWSRIIPGTIKSLLLNQHPIIRSDGTYKRDYIYVEDVVDSYMSLAEQIHKKNVCGEAFNFGPNNPICSLEIVNIIIEKMNLQEYTPIILNQAKAEIKDQWLSSEKAIKTLGWESKFNMADGLDRTINWYKKYLLKSSKISEENYAGI